MVQEKTPGSNPDVCGEERRIIADYLAGGDERLFEILVRRYKDRVFRLALSVLGPARAADAEDVTQEAFVRAHKNLPRFRHECRFGTWLYRLAYNTAIDHTRRARFRRPHLTQEVLASKPARLEGNDPYRNALEIERNALVQSAVARLPHPMRSVFYLHYWLDSSVEEIAEYLGLPAGTIKSYLYRGRAQVHGLLMKWGWPDE